MLYQKIVDLLKTSNIEYEEIRHEPVYTSDEATKVRGCKPEEGAKALVFWADKIPIQIVLEGNKKINKGLFKKLYGVKDLQMVSKNELIEISGVEPGAVPPFGTLFNIPLKIYCNETLLENDFIEFNAGDHCISIRMKANDWKKLVNPVVQNFALIETEPQPVVVKSDSILSIDYGTRKIGTALYKNGHAVPLKILDNKPNSGIEIEAMNEIANVIKEENIHTIVLGIPLLRGKENKETQKIREFGNHLKKLINKKIDYIDESYSTEESKAGVLEHGVPKRQRMKDDGFAALTILSRYLEKSDS